MKDREVLVTFPPCTLSPEERIAAKASYTRAEHANVIPIGNQMLYSQYVMSDEFRLALHFWETHLEEVWGIKERTARGYSIIIVGAKWIYDRYESHFLTRGFSWDHFVSSFLINEWGPTVKLAHIELTNAKVICHDFAWGAVQLMSKMDLTEV